MSYHVRAECHRPLHSTETVMVRLTNDLLSSTLTGGPSVVVALDMSAAFDCVCHQKLTDRLIGDFGVGGAVLGWIGSYLEGRTQFVKVGEAASGMVEVAQGVPQGSVLGPMLFTTYVSPVSRLIDSYGVNHLSYADDFTLYVSLGNDAAAALKKIEDCTYAVANWLAFNDLQLNASKSEVLQTGTTGQLKKTDGYSVVVAGACLTCSNHIKILGVTLDNKLNFDRHVSAICTSTYYHLRGLRHIRKSLDTTVANTIACSIIGSRLDYCNSVLAGVSDHCINRLQRVQNSAARVVLNVSSRSSTKDSLSKLHWLPIEHRIDFKIALLTFKALTTHEPDYLFSLLETYTPTRIMRSSASHSLVQPFCSTSLASRAFSIYAARCWNSLPQSLRNSVTVSPVVSLPTFKRHLKTLHFNIAYNSGSCTFVDFSQRLCYHTR
jgi:hypothetical protein